MLEDVLHHVLDHCGSANHRHLEHPRAQLPDADWITRALTTRPPVPCVQCHSEQHPASARRTHTRATGPTG
ncbi:hypothetical protein [Goodfellowiella coeruleoviolacea]|uniref:hypothetical protein n=1 Tax=Goodfellowiella coeruleoviolacea TaxID=334858 RepID=UPI0020A2DE70|nr:hypothetical protein [Goodfellowiella coeruleoviolacea]